MTWLLNKRIVEHRGYYLDPDDLYLWAELNGKHLKEGEMCIDYGDDRGEDYVGTGVYHQMTWTDTIESLSDDDLDEYLEDDGLVYSYEFISKLYERTNR